MGLSLYDYEMSQRINARGYPFYALIAAAMRQADTDNLEKLKAMYPIVWQDLRWRYNSPGGVLPSEKGEKVSGH